MGLSGFTLGMFMLSHDTWYSGACVPAAGRLIVRCLGELSNVSKESSSPAMSACLVGWWLGALRRRMRSNKEKGTNLFSAAGCM